MKSYETAVLSLARRQHAVITARQARACGLTPEQIKHRRETGRLLTLHRGVYALAGAPRTWEQALMAACLSAGGVASHLSAAGLWELRGCERGPLHVTVAGRRAPQLRGAQLHEATVLERIDRTVRRGIPVTTPARTVVDLAAVAGPEVVEPALEDVLLRGLATFALVQRTVERLAAPGRPGSALLRRLVAERVPGQAATESDLEDALVAVLREGGLPPPVRQHEVVGPGGQVFRLDLAYPAVRLAIEADSRRWHGARGDVERNAAKANALVLLGWRVLRFTWDDVRRRPASVVASVAHELGRQGAR